MYKKILSKELSAFELDHHYEALLILAMQDEPVTQNRLAELLQIDKSRMVNIIFNLQQRDMLYTQQNPADRRQHYVYLSPAAKASIRHIEDVIEQTNKLAEDGITPEKLTTFFEVSEMMQRNLARKGA